MQFSSILTTDKTLSGATIPGQSAPRSDGSEEVLCIPQSSSITGISSSDCLMTYPGHSLEWRLPLCREMQLGYSTANWETNNKVSKEVQSSSPIQRRKMKSKIHKFSIKHPRGKLNLKKKSVLKIQLSNPNKETLFSLKSKKKEILEATQVQILVEAISIFNVVIPLRKL